MTFLSLKRGEYKSADYSIINLVGNPVETELRNRVTCYIKSKQQRIWLSSRPLKRSQIGFHSEYIRSGVVDTNLVAYRAKEIQETLPLFIDNDIYRILMKTSLSSLLPDEFALCFDYKQKVLIDRLSQEEIYIHPYRYNTSQFKSHRYILVYATSMLLNTVYELLVSLIVRTILVIISKKYSSEVCSIWRSIIQSNSSFSMMIHWPLNMPNNWVWRSVPTISIVLFLL